jgi:uncharacterized protein (DUF58 family)
VVKPQPPEFRYLDPETLQRISHLELMARNVVEGLRVGMHKSPLRGFSTEFAQHRQYVPGDALRHIDWRVYGRTMRYYVKLYEAETNFDANLLLDASRSMRYGSGGVSKLEYAKCMAAAMAHLIVGQHDCAGLAVFDDRLRDYIPPRSSGGVVRNIVELLAKTEPEPKTNVAALLHEFAQRIPRRGYVMLFSDLFDDVDGFLKGLANLRFRGHNVAVFHILDPYELRFPFNGNWQFQGLELDGEITTQPRRIRDAYLAELNRFVARIRKSCEGSGADYVLVDTGRPVDVVLREYLTGHVTRTKIV